jgi:hypothetical protein
MVNGIHAGDDGQQHLGGADIAGGRIPTNVLFSGLQGQAQGGFAVAGP